MRRIIGVCFGQFDHPVAQGVLTDEKLIFKEVNADKMKIVPSTGAFSTDSATIGLSNGATESASTNGYFASSDAEGVDGLAYSNDTQNYTRAFYGKKSQ